MPGESVKNENQDVQFQDRPERSVPRLERRANERFLKKSNCAGLQNLDLLRELRRSLPRRHAAHLEAYLVDVLAEAINSISWRKILGEAHRRVSLYYLDEQNHPKP